MANNYFFFDGSSLIAEIRAIQESRGEFKDRRLYPVWLVNRARNTGLLNQLTLGAYRRAVFYFAKDDPQVGKYVAIPDLRTPEVVQDILFRFCGERMKTPSGFDDWYATQPPEYQRFCYKREKGVDIEICCDALQLAASGNLDRLILLTNDSDFIPLCEKLKAFGSNISLLKLSSSKPVNNDLVNACDTYHILEGYLEHLFVPPGS